jgi:hypothetical protein
MSARLQRTELEDACAAERRSLGLAVVDARFVPAAVLRAEVAEVDLPRLAGGRPDLDDVAARGRRDEAQHAAAVVR